MKKLRDWFIGDYLAKTDNVFEQAKITLTYNFAIFFMIQAAALYINVIANHLWYHFYFISFGWLSMAFMLYVIKMRQNIRLASLVWLFQFVIIGTANMLIQGGGTDLMSGFWILVELLFAYFTLGGKWAVFALVHVLSMLTATILNETHFHGKLLDLGIPTNQKMADEPVFTLIPFILCVYIITHFVRTRNIAENLVHKQKLQLEEKNKETTDSINYAKYIQKAILPSQEFISTRLPESFVIYLPKSIVSGDFYWVQEKDGKLFFAVCDCTGHGVPGAMMSVIAQNILNRTIFALNLTKPAEILDKASQLMETTLAQGGGNMRDGMDIALCVLDKKNNSLEYAGAGNPLYFISFNELKEFKANKQPVGKFEARVPFTNHKIPFDKGDIVYLFSDGMADQFGGPDAKKFKYKAMKELFIANYMKTPEEQKKIIIDTFTKWKGSLEQIDDVCIMGVRL